MNTSLERLRVRRERLEDKEGGFTLIELLIVIVILAILAAIVVFAVQNLSSTSAKASCGTDFKTVESATEAYKAQLGTYPTVKADNSNFIVPAGDTSNPSTTTDATTVNGKLNGINALLSTVTLSDGTTVGPWLKDVPINTNHYQIVASNASATGSPLAPAYAVPGAVSVWNTATPAVEIGTALTSADCATVS